MTLTGQVAGGTIAGSTITVPAGASAWVGQSVVLIASEDVAIDGTLDAYDGASITIVSLNRNIRIGAGGSVRGGYAKFGNPATGGLFSLAQAGPGASGQPIRLIAPKGNIDVQGRIEGQTGERVATR